MNGPLWSKMCGIDQDPFENTFFSLNVASKSTGSTEKIQIKSPRKSCQNVLKLKPLASVLKLKSREKLTLPPNPRETCYDFYRISARGEEHKRIIMLVARQGLLCREPQKSDVCASVVVRHPSSSVVRAHIS